LNYYPKNDFEIDESIPDKARNYLEQAQDSIQSPDACIMVCASALDVMLQSIGLENDEGSLFARIKKAADQHKITQGMAEWAHQVRMVANDSRHPDEDLPTATIEDAKQSLEFVRALAEILFVFPARVERGIEQAKGEDKSPNGDYKDSTATKNQIILYAMNPQNTEFGELIGHKDNQHLNSVIQDKKNSVLMSIDFELPNLSADLISAYPFALRAIEELLPVWQEFSCQDKNKELKFAISDVAIYCRDGSKKGKLQIILQVVDTAGVFLERAGTAIRRAGIGIAAVLTAEAMFHNDSEKPHQKLMENIYPIWQNMIINIDTTPSKDAGGYRILNVKTSHMLNYKNAQLMIGKDNKGDSLIKYNDTANSEEVIIRYSRDSLDAPFQRDDEDG
jgi:hypothetical protein